ncbi:MAG: YicC/YloC family endoribonuclease [Verrucomicrobiota bacterium]
MRSMTGYGRGEQIRAGTRVLVELRSVNRRQVEVSLRLPPELDPVESRLREEILKNVARGRVDARVFLELPAESSGTRLNAAVAAAYARELTELTSRLGLTGGVTLEALLRCPGVLQTSPAEGDPEASWALVGPALRQALDAFNGMRDREGGALAADLSARISELRAAVGRIRDQAPAVVQRYREQMLQRIRLAGVDGIAADDERVLREVVLFADRSDINEELTRLDSHFAQFDDCLRSQEPLGRKLDFLAQEMNREVNTIGSKANDAAIAADVVLLKTELERFREQAQNVE